MQLQRSRFDRGLIIAIVSKIDNEEGDYGNQANYFSLNAYFILRY